MHRLNHLYRLSRPSPNLCTKTRSNILQSGKDYVSVSDRRVSYTPQDWPNSYVSVMVGCSDMSKFTEGGWQEELAVNNKRAV